MEKSRVPGTDTWAISCTFRVPGGNLLLEIWATEQTQTFHHLALSLLFDILPQTSDQCWSTFVLMGHSQPLFLYFRLFGISIHWLIQLIYFIADVRIRTTDLWCQRQPLCQLHQLHGQEKKFFSFIFRSSLNPTCFPPLGGKGNGKGKSFEENKHLGNICNSP